MSFSGIIPAMVTPLTKEQTINEPVTRQLINRLIRAGVHGIFALGTNGEFHLLSAEEKVRLARIIVEEVNGRVPVIVGTGGIGTQDVITLSAQMKEIGADAVSVITPYFIPQTQEELLYHYEKIAGSVDLPIILYNIPGRTGVSLNVETVAKLAKVPNIIGIKDSSGKLENVQQYIEATKDEDFSVLVGTDSLILKTLLAGGVGAVAGTANLLPELVVSIYDHWRAGNLDEAQKAQELLQPLRDSFQYGTLPSVLKKAMELYGIPVGPPRLPVAEVTGEALKKVEDMIAFYQNRG